MANSITDIKKLIEKHVVWKKTGERIYDRTWNNFSPCLNAIYWVSIICKTGEPLRSGYKGVALFTAASAIATGTYITSRKTDNNAAILNMIFDNTKRKLKLDGGDPGGVIYRLEELKAEYLYAMKDAWSDIKESDKMDITRPLNVTSESLKITPLVENTSHIVLKGAPLSPSKGNWREVGFTSNKTATITSHFKKN